MKGLPDVSPQVLGDLSDRLRQLAEATGKTPSEVVAAFYEALGLTDRLDIYVKGGKFPIACVLRTTNSVTFTPEDLRRYAAYGEEPEWELTPEELAEEDALLEAILASVDERNEP